MMNYQEIGYHTIELVKKVGSFISTERKSFSLERVEHKGKSDLVSYVDKTAEERLVEGLSELVPQAGFIAEEGTSSPKEGMNWIIDPLDGTTNFVHGTPPYAISVALAQENEVVLGVVYEITSDECFFSWKGAPVYLNGEEIKTSATPQMSDMLVATGFPYTNFTCLDNYMELMKEIMHETQGIRRMGSAATDLAYVAAGRYDGFWEYGLNPWDVAAGSFLVKQAGGKVSDFNGGDNYMFGGEMVASNSIVFADFLNTVKSHLGK